MIEIRYIMHNYRKIKRTEIKETIELTKEYLALKEALEKNGLYDSKSDDHLKKSSVKIAQELEKLLEGEPAVRVNDKEYWTGGSARNLKSLKNRINLLEPPKETEEKIAIIKIENL